MKTVWPGKKIHVRVGEWSGRVGPQVSHHQTWLLPPVTVMRDAVRYPTSTLLSRLKGACAGMKAMRRATPIAAGDEADLTPGRGTIVRGPWHSVQDEPSDAELVARCRAGDARAWEQLVRRYQRLIYSVPMRCGLSDDEAADVFQQTCLRLLERLDTLNDPSRLGGWLATTSRHLALDALAKRHREQPLGTAPADVERADEARLPQEGLEILEEQHRIRRAVAQLSPPCRTLVYHLFYDPVEPSYQQIAAALGMPKGSIGPVRARCFAKLKAILERC